MKKLVPLSLLLALIALAACGDREAWLFHDSSGCMIENANQSNTVALERWLKRYMRK